jgi:hypothetical protein
MKPRSGTHLKSAGSLNYSRTQDWVGTTPLMPSEAKHTDDRDVHSDEDEDEDEVNQEDYAARMDEIMDSDEDDEEGFVYDGVDAPQQEYKDQLRDALSDDDAESFQNEKEEQTVEHLVGTDIAFKVHSDNGDDELTSNGVCIICSRGLRPCIELRLNRTLRSHCPRAF